MHMDIIAMHILHIIMVALQRFMLLSSRLRFSPSQAGGIITPFAAFVKH